ncbi:hypothetical protein BJ912DRAFT_1000893 [Pholiota molesta]|nr:hypothetical protein BJ912DRAFT_1000893 [Pholiota molesta]
MGYSPSLDVPHYEGASAAYSTAPVDPYSTGADVEMTLPHPDESLYRRGDGLCRGYTSPLVVSPQESTLPLISSGVRSLLPHSSGTLATAPANPHSFGAEVDTHHTQFGNSLGSALDTSKQGELTARLMMMRSQHIYSLPKFQLKITIASPKRRL